MPESFKHIVFSIFLVLRALVESWFVQYCLRDQYIIALGHRTLTVLVYPAVVNVLTGSSYTAACDIICIHASPAATSTAASDAVHYYCPGR